TVAPGAGEAGVLAVVGAVTFTPLAAFSALLNGTDPGSDYSQLVAGGPIDLGGSALSLILGFTPEVDDSFTLLSSADLAGVTGTFAGLDEGAVFNQDGLLFQITYRGGPSGTSVVLTRLA